MPNPTVAIDASYPTVQVSRLALREGNAKKPVYTMHKWWARRLGTVFRMLLIAEAQRESRSPRELWKRFYSSARLPDGFTILDPFLGGGTSLIEAAKLGANCIGVDIDPVACFVTQMELASIDPEAVTAAASHIEARIGSRIKELYRSKISGRTVDVIYNFWVDRITCLSCSSTHDGHPTFQMAHDMSVKTQLVVCPQCGELTETKLGRKWCQCSSCQRRIPLSSPPVANGRFTCPKCGEAHPLHELYRKRRVSPRLFAMEYLDPDGHRGFAPIGPMDEALYAQAASLLKKWSGRLPIPESPIPIKGRADRRPLLYGYTHYRQMFNDRQLYCLGLIASEIQSIPDLSVRQALALAFSQCLATNNMFCGYAFGYRRLTPLFGVHSYRKISRPVEGNVWGLSLGRGSFLNAVRAVTTGAAYMRSPFEYRYGPQGVPKRVVISHSRSGERAFANASPRIRILNQNACDLSAIEKGSIDIILTDPPYFDNISYSELSDFYHVWLRKLLGRDYCGHRQSHTPLATALFGGHRKGNAATRTPRQVYRDSLKQVFGECKRVLKNNGKLIFTFHHRSQTAWAALGTCLILSGFQVMKVFPVRSEGRSGFHSYEGSLKWDSVFICKKQPTLAKTRASDAMVSRIAKRARLRATTWRRKIRKAGLDFSDADEGSLRCSLVIREFSGRSIRSRHLPACFAHTSEFV